MIFSYLKIYQKNIYLFIHANLYSNSTIAQYIYKHINILPSDILQYTIDENISLNMLQTVMLVNKLDLVKFNTIIGSVLKRDAFKINKIKLLQIINILMDEPRTTKFIQLMFNLWYAEYRYPLFTNEKYNIVSKLVKQNLTSIIFPIFDIVIERKCVNRDVIIYKSLSM